MTKRTPKARAGIYSRQSKDKTKSIDEQTVECAADVEEQGWTVAEKYSDGVSASRFAKKARVDWPRLLADLEAGRLDVLVLWESSRGDRDPESWLGLLRRCRDRKVRIRVTSHERTYNLAIPADWKALATEGIDGAYESEKTSLRLKRAVAAGAKAGKPHGPVIYGYQRVYEVDDRGKRRLVEQRRHPDQGPIVQEIFKRVARGEAVSAIVRDLNERGVPAPRAGSWGRNTVRAIALHIGYLGKRELRGEIYDAKWPALVDEPTALAARRRLTDPARVTSKPGAQRWLLSGLALCECGKPLRGRPEREGKHGRTYLCRNYQAGCVSVLAGDPDGEPDEGLDAFILAVVVERLSRRDAIDVFTDGSTEAEEALAEVDRLQGKLEEWRDSAAKGETTPASLASIEASLTKQITAARSKAVTAAVPPALRELVEDLADIDPDDVQERAARVEARLKVMPVEVQRRVVDALMVIRVHRSSTWGRHAFDPLRVEVTPKA